MEDIFCLALSFLGLMSTLKGQPLDTTGYEDGPFHDRPSSTIPGYHDDEQLRQSRRRERGKDRRAQESRRHR
jgi:hypothetical protein